MTNNPVQDAEPAMAEQGAHISRPGPTQAIAPMGNNRIGMDGTDTDALTKLDPRKIIEAVKSTHKALSAINPKWAMEAAELHQNIIVAARKL